MRGEANHPLLLVLLRALYHHAVALPVLIGEEGASIAAEPRLPVDTDPRCMVDDQSLELTDCVSFQEAGREDLTR